MSAKKKTKKLKDTASGLKYGADEIKRTYTNYGLNYIDPSLTREWELFVDINTNDEYSCSILRLILFYLNKLEQGLDIIMFNNYFDNAKFNDCTIEAIKSSLMFFSIRKEELKEHWSALSTVSKR